MAKPWIAGRLLLSTCRACGQDVISRIRSRAVCRWQIFVDIRPHMGEESFQKDSSTRPRDIDSFKVQGLAQ